MWQLIIGFYLYNLFEYFIHFISHCKYNSYLKYYHLLHHKKSYPITKLLDYAPYKSDRYAFLSFGPYILCYAGVLYYTFKLNVLSAVFIVIFTSSWYMQHCCPKNFNTGFNYMYQRINFRLNDKSHETTRYGKDIIKQIILKIINY